MLTDDRGSVVGVVDPSVINFGQIEEQLYYNMTGLCRNFYGPDVPNVGGQEKFRADGSGYNLGRSEKVPFGYLGMYHDPFTGLYHTHFREYDAVHGRWLSEDPAGYADGLNLYQAYMGVNGRDPLGLGMKLKGTIVSATDNNGNTYLGFPVEETYAKEWKNVPGTAMGYPVLSWRDAGIFWSPMPVRSGEEITEELVNNRLILANDHVRINNNLEYTEGNVLLLETAVNLVPFGNASDKLVNGDIKGGIKSAAVDTAFIAGGYVIGKAIGAGVRSIRAARAARAAQLASTLDDPLLATTSIVSGNSDDFLRLSGQICTSEVGSVVGPVNTMPKTGAYGELTRELSGTGLQANHLNQNAVFRSVIPQEEGIAVGMRGNIFTEINTPHYEFHAGLEKFWDIYRPGGALEGLRPTCAQYGIAVEQSLIRAGYSPAEAAYLSEQAALQRATYGLQPVSLVPRVPGRLPQLKP